MKGFIIESFADDSPAKKAGLQAGDIIIKFGKDNPAENINNIAQEVKIPTSGLEITYLRSGKEDNLTVIGERFGFVATKIDAPKIISAVETKPTAQTQATVETKPTVQTKPTAETNVESPLIHNLNIKSKYGAGRALATLSLYLGWLFLVIGAVSLVISITNSNNILIAPSSIIILAGWIGIQQSQLILAITDAADAQSQATNILYTMLIEKNNTK